MVRLENEEMKIEISSVRQRHLSNNNEVETGLTVIT